MQNILELGAGFWQRKAHVTPTNKSNDSRKSAASLSKVKTVFHHTPYRCVMLAGYNRA